MPPQVSLLERPAINQSRAAGPQFVSNWIQSEFGRHQASGVAETGFPEYFCGVFPGTEFSCPTSMCRRLPKVRHIESWSDCGAFLWLPRPIGLGGKYSKILECPGFRPFRPPRNTRLHGLIAAGIHGPEGSAGESASPVESLDEPDSLPNSSCLLRNRVIVPWVKGHSWITWRSCRSR